MSTAIAKREVEVVANLDELAEIVRREHSLVQESISTGVAHAILCGDALLAARRAAPVGEWRTWCVDLGVSTNWAGTYMRLAHYKEVVKSQPTIALAIQSLKGQPNVIAGLRPNPTERVWLEDARRMRDAGMFYYEIAATIGVSHSVVYKALNPNSKSAQNARQHNLERSRRQTERRRLERATKRQETLKMAGGGLSEAYSQARRLAQVLDGLARNGESVEIRQAADAAVRKIHQVEDLIAKSIGA